jgi:hypothetical protein
VLCLNDYMYQLNLDKNFIHHIYAAFVLLFSNENLVCLLDSPFMSHGDCDDDDDLSCDAWQVTVLEESAPRVPVEQLKGESSCIMFFSLFYQGHFELGSSDSCSY